MALQLQLTTVPLILVLVFACKSPREKSAETLSYGAPAQAIQLCAINCQAQTWTSGWSAPIEESPRAIGQFFGVVKPTVEYRWFNRETHLPQSGKCDHISAQAQNKQWTALIKNRYYPNPTSASCSVVAHAKAINRLERMEIEHFSVESGVTYHRIEYQENHGSGLKVVKEDVLSPR